MDYLDSNNDFGGGGGRLKSSSSEGFLTRVNDAPPDRSSYDDFDLNTGLSELTGTVRSLCWAFYFHDELH